MDRENQNGTPERFPTMHLLAQSASELIDEIAERSETPKYPTGLEVLDRGCHGLHKGKVFTIAARTSQGKSAFITQLILNLATQKKLKTTLVTLEMGHKEVIERMFCIKYRVDGFSMLQGKIKDKTKEWCEFANFLHESDKNGYMRIVDDYCTKESELMTLVEHLQHRPDVLIIDHINHIQPENYKMDERIAISMYARYLKEISRRFNIAVVLVAQINREGSDKPTLKDLKGSGTLEEVSDAVCLLQMLDTTNEMHNFNIYLAKNRFGARGKFDAYFHGPWFKFYASRSDFVADGGTMPVIRQPDYTERKIK